MKLNRERSTRRVGWKKEGQTFFLTPEKERRRRKKSDVKSSRKISS